MVRETATSLLLDRKRFEKVAAWAVDAFAQVHKDVDVFAQVRKDVKNQNSWKHLL